MCHWQVCPQLRVPFVGCSCVHASVKSLCSISRATTRKLPLNSRNCYVRSGLATTQIQPSAGSCARVAVGRLARPRRTPLQLSKDNSMIIRLVCRRGYVR